MADPIGQGDSAPVAGQHRGGFPPAVLAGVALAIAFAALAVTTVGFPDSARGYPLFVLLGGALLMLGSAAKNHRSAPEVEVSATGSWRDLRVLGFLAVWVLYAVALVTVGFLISTVAALAASLLILRVRHAAYWALGTVPVALLFFALFQVVLNIALPQSPLDRAVADLLYEWRG